MTHAPTGRVDVEPSLDPDVRRFVESSRGSLFPPLGNLPANRLRATVNAALLSHDRIGYVVEPVFRMERTAYADVPTRVFFPGSEPTAVIVYFHGGGFVAGSLDTHDKTTRRLTNAISAITVSVDYALSPEHPSPRPLEDAIAATREAARRYPFLPLIVMGDSAGGSLAASVAQSAHDSGLAVAGQVLVYPVIDFDFESTSMREYGSDYLLTRDDLERYYKDYLGDAPQPSPHGLPGSRRDLRGLAPAVVALSRFDPLHDEGARYARRLADQDVDVLLVEHENLIHGWLEVVDVIPAAAAARDQLLDDVTDLIRRTTRTR